MERVIVAYLSREENNNVQSLWLLEFIDRPECESSELLQGCVFIGLHVADIDRAVDFYQHVLGFWLSNKVCKENKETASLISYLYLINRNDSQLFYLELVSFNELQRS